MSIHPLSKYRPNPNLKLTKEDIFVFLDYCFKECGGYFLVGSICSHDLKSKNLFNYLKRTNPEFFSELIDHSHLDYYFDLLEDERVNVKYLRLTKQYGLFRGINDPLPPMVREFSDFFDNIMKSAIFPDWIQPDNPADPNTTYHFAERINPDTGEVFEIKIDYVWDSPEEEDINKAIITVEGRLKEMKAHGFEYVFVPEVLKGKNYKKATDILHQNLHNMITRKTNQKNSLARKENKKERKEQSKAPNLVVSHLTANATFEELKPSLHITEKRYPGVQIFDKAYDSGFMSAQEKYRFDREIFLENKLSDEDFDHKTGEILVEVTHQDKKIGKDYIFGIYGR